MDFSRSSGDSPSRPNQTAREMMHSFEILVEHFRGLIFRSTQGRRLGINAAILPNSLARSCAREEDSKASK